MAWNRYYVRVRFVDGQSGTLPIRAQTRDGAIRGALREIKDNAMDDMVSSMAIVGDIVPADKKKRKKAMKEAREAYREKYEF